MKKKLVLMTSALMAISLLAGCNKHTHEWGEVTYTWSADNATCTAERVCKGDESHKETEVANSTYNVVSEAKCEEDGTGRYSVSFTNEAFTTQTKDITLEAIGHEWGTPTYTWSDDYSSCTATRVCKNDPNHIESETADSAYTEIIPATCDTDGSAVYDAAFENEAFEVQSHEITLPATGHEWGAITYTWSDDNLTCTARRVCAHDATHVDTETVNSTYVVVEEAKCEEDGIGRYTADFTKEAFANQTKDIALEAIGHDYQFAEFVWTEFTAQAKYVCSHDASHVQLHDATVTNEVTTQPGCETEGVRTYTATYDGHTSTKTGPVSATGHDWDTPTYTWSADHTSCKAEKICSNDASHKIEETVNSVRTIENPTYEESSKRERYTATFADSSFETQIYDIVLEKYHGETPLLSKDGKHVKYGIYPQTNVNDATLVSALNALTTPESNGWYLYDNEYYAKVSATTNYSSYVFDNGTTIVNGTTYWFKCEPITWNVLSNTNGEYYILSSVLLDAHCYYNSTSTRTIGGKTIYPTNYEYSDIRTWLNADFYNSAFVLGNSYIQTTTVDNSASTTNSSSNKYTCNNTQDKVFLPSYQDYINSSYGFSTSTGSTDTRCCRTTDWARARGAYYDTDSGSHQYNGYYWTRSPRGDYANGTMRVGTSGYIDSFNVDRTSSSVRPGLSITIA
jgi:hypothetical protein